MVEKWTAADEKLWAELEARREQLYTRHLTLLEEAFDDAGVGLDSASIDGVVANAIEITAALEPFVLRAREPFDET